MTRRAARLDRWTAATSEAGTAARAAPAGADRREDRPAPAATPVEGGPEAASIDPAPVLVPASGDVPVAKPD